jgi:hypothetical protein
MDDILSRSSGNLDFWQLLDTEKHRNPEGDKS